MNTNLEQVNEITKERLAASQEDAVRGLVRAKAMMEDEIGMLGREVRRLTAILNRHGVRHNPTQAAITVELLKFKDGIRHIDESQVTEDDAHHLKNQLARFYAEHITTMLEQEHLVGAGPRSIFATQEPCERCIWWDDWGRDDG